MSVITVTPKRLAIPAELQDVHPERQTIVHCTLSAAGLPAHQREGTLVRIWPTTYLIQENGLRRNLIHFERIAPFPYWMPVILPHTFTLIFEGLDAGCQVFDLIEEIPQEGGFEVKGIARNAQDVYRVTL